MSKFFQVRKAELYSAREEKNQMSNSVAGPYVESDSSNAKNWFAVLTVPRHEKKVETHFGLRQIEHFLPMYEKKREWKDGSKGMLQLPLFASYIFVRIGCYGRTPVLKVPGVISIVGCGAQPMPVPDSYIHWLREGLRQGKIEPYPDLAAGTKVRIRSGMMAGMEGILVRRKNHFRVVLTLEMIMKSVTVEVELQDIEPVDRTSCVSEPEVVVVV
jgi:transcription antitermination factor NusG